MKLEEAFLDTGAPRVIRPANDPVANIGTRHFFAQSSSSRASKLLADTLLRRPCTDAGAYTITDGIWTRSLQGKQSAGGRSVSHDHIEDDAST